MMQQEGGNASATGYGQTVAFLFLGETLLIPHLYPIADALARLRPDLRIDLWVSTSVHSQLLRRWVDEGGHGNIRTRRAPGYRRLSGFEDGRNPPLPPKLPMLARLAPRLWNVPVAVCAEQTSLWLPRLLPMPTRFLKTSHGVGSMSARDDPRRRAAWRLLVPSPLEQETYLRRGFSPETLKVTGYVKSAFAHLAPPPRLFADDKPVVLYTPHWQQNRSSWWAWGREMVAALAAQDRFNVILAPHQRLAEKDPGVREVLAGVSHLPHIHADMDSFAMVDGSYTAAADIYLGDSSSQVVEFLARPRPCVFLNAHRLDWQARDDHAFWTCGDVVDGLEEVLPALGEAVSRHERYVDTQRVFAEQSLGTTGPEAALNAAAEVIAALG